MADPTLNKLAIEQMGHVEEKVMEFANKPNIPPRKSRSNADVSQNGSTDHEVSSATVPSPKARAMDRKNKFRKSVPPSLSNASIGPPAVVVSNEAEHTISPQKAVYTMHEQKYETVTEMSLNDIKAQISDNTSNTRHSRLTKSPSPENLDSSFDETSDEDVITDRVMGKDVEPAEEPSSPPPPIKPDRKNKTGTRGRASAIVKPKGNAGSQSPVEHRKNLKALSESFKSSGSTSSVTRSQTFTEPSPRPKYKMQRPPGSPLSTRSSTTSNNASPLSATNLPEFVYLECEETYSRMRSTTDAPPPISSCNELPKAISTLPCDTRHRIIQEIYTSEWSYVNGLEIVVEVFKKPLKSTLNATEIDSIFGNVEDLLSFNLCLLSEFHRRLSQWNEESTIGDIFVTNFTQQHKTMYGVYCNNYDKAEQLLLKLLKRKKDYETAVNNCLSNPRVMKGLRVDSFLITPVQRIPKYKLLIGDLLKETPQEHDDHSFLEGALGKLTELAEYMNAQRLEVETVKKVQELQKKMVEILHLSKDRVIIKEGMVCLQRIRKPYKCVLFNNLLVFARSRDRESRQIVELRLELESVWVDDLRDLDPLGVTNEDAIEVYTPERPYIVYTGSKNEKKLWLTAIRETIYNLLLKEEKCPDSPEKSITCRRATFVYASSRVYTGDYCDGRRHGYGEMHWPDKTVYKGHWEDDDRCGEGELTYNTGEVYKGQWRDDKQNGIGTIRYNNDDEYHGNWYDGIKNGLGDIVYSNMDRFQGMFRYGQIQGKGKLTCTNGLVYDGEWLNSQRCGKGKLKLVSGDQYEGDFSNNLIDGRGTMKYANGDVYEGQWENGLRQGSGVLKMTSGETYEGLWDNNMRNKKGKATYTSGDVYEGLWMNNLRHGQGRMTFANGDVYTGKFDHDTITGEGDMRYNVGGKYNGCWKNGKHHGRGTMVYPDRATYNGEWRHGLRSGEGEYITANGTSYIGQWAYDKPHGKGKLITPNEEYTYEGEWVNGLREGKGREVTQSGVHEGEWKANNKHGSGIERSLVGTVYEGRWMHNQKSSRGVRKMVFGDQEEQIWSSGNLVSENHNMTCVELPQLPRIDY